MPVTIPSNPFEFESIRILLKAAILIILVLYAIFALVVVRQVNLMSQTLISKVSPVLKALSLLNVGFAVGLIVLVWGIL